MGILEDIGGSVQGVFDDVLRPIFDPGNVVVPPETATSAGLNNPAFQQLLQQSGGSLSAKHYSNGDPGLFYNPSINTNSGGDGIYQGQSVRDQALSGYQNAGTRAAPQSQAAQAQLNTRAQGAVATPAQAINAARVNQGMLQPGQQTMQQGLGAAAGARGQSNATRGQQQQALGLFADAAQGKAPSVAEQQLQSGMAAGLRQNMALAASNRGSGSSGALAQRAAIEGNANLAARTNAQAAQLRAGEMAQARGEYGNALQGVRGQDLALSGLGLQQAGLGVQQQGQGAQLALGQAQLQNQAALANQSTQLQQLTQNTANQQAANMANFGGALAIAQQNAGLNQQTALANQQAQLAQTNMNDQRAMQELGAVLGIDARTQQGQQALAALLVNAQLQTDATNAGIGMSNTAGAINQQNGLLAAAGSLFA